MTDHAIVIGLDKYENSSWNLLAAVADAVQFAKWVTEPNRGRASRETLTLLLSPRDGVEPELPFKLATQKTMTEALRRYTKGVDVDGAERLWFFYAGHAVSESSSAPDDPPVLVPPDVLNIEDYLFESPLALSKYLGALQVNKPKVQIFFIDACRGLVEAKSPFQATSGLTWDLSKLGKGLAGAQSQQAVLYAATLGESANELGASGLFSRALREGLRGRGPELKPDAQASRLVLGFNSLTGFAQSRVRRLVADAIKKDPTRKLQIQEPTPSLHRNAGDLVLDQFEELPPAKLRVFVTPPEALPKGSAGIKTFEAHTGKFGLAEKRSPIPEPLVWELAPGQRTFQLSSPGYRNTSRTVELVDELVVAVELHEEEPPAREAFESAESVSFESLHHPDDLAERLAPNRGRLFVKTHDRRARVTLRDATGELVASGQGDLSFDLIAGSYQASVTFPGLPPVDKPIFIDEGERERWEVAPAVGVSPRLQRVLSATFGGFSDGLAEPSETFGKVTSVKLGSLLAWAAWAARFPSSPYGHKLRALALSTVPSAVSAVQVLIGDAVGGTDFLASVDVRFGAADREERVRLEPLATLPGMALEVVLPLAPPPERLVISATNLKPLIVPVPALPGFVHVIVVAAESDGTTEVHRYLLPLHPAAAGHSEFSDAVRTTEIFSRALAARTALLPGEAEAALADPRLDPLTTALLGYRLVHEKRSADLASPWGAALNRAARLAPALPDLHVLAALSAPDAVERTQHMKLASAAGVPLVADGFVAFAAWLEDQAAETGEAPPVALHPLVRGGAWSLLELERRRVEDSRVALPAASLQTSRAPWARLIRPVVSATMRVEVEGARLVASAFLVGPGRLLSMSFVLPEGALTADAVLPAGWYASGPERLALRRLLAISRATSPDATSSSIRVALIETDSSSAPPIRLDTAVLRVGQRVAVIGHNVLGSNVDGDEELARARVFAALSSGEKGILPGEVTTVAADGGSFTYDCWTLAGSAGGPVVDLETGAVVGIHYGGTGGREAKKLGVGVPLSCAALDSIWARLP